MRRITKWAAIVVVLVLATMASGCSFLGCDVGNENAPHTVHSQGLRLENANRVAVDVPLQLHAWVIYDPRDVITQQDRDLDAANMKWGVQPSDGAVVSSTGVFKATKAGAYTVTVSYPRYTTTTKVFVTEAGSTTTVTSEVTPTEESTTTIEATITTETTVTNTFAGTYKGSWLWTAGKDHASVPWEFTVDNEGNFKGGFDSMLTVGTRAVCVLSGKVSDDGKVAASGTATSTVAGVGSNSTPMTLSGQISGGSFTGKLVGSGGKSVEVTATRQ